LIPVNPSTRQLAAGPGEFLRISHTTALSVRFTAIRGFTVPENTKSSAVPETSQSWNAEATAAEAAADSRRKPMCIAINHLWTPLCEGVTPRRDVHSQLFAPTGPVSRTTTLRARTAAGSGCSRCGLGGRTGWLPGRARPGGRRRRVNQGGPSPPPLLMHDRH
jgi:hypothetical protein